MLLKTYSVTITKKRTFSLPISVKDDQDEMDAYQIAETILLTGEQMFLIKDNTTWEAEELSTTFETEET